MAFHNSNTQIYNDPSAASPNTVKGPMSHWIPIGIFCASVFFFVLGGGLLGAWASSTSCSYDYYYDFCTGNVGEYDAGIAFIVIGALLKLAFWVVLIMWCVQRRRLRSSPSTAVYVNAQASAENGQANKPQPTANVQGVNQNYTSVPLQDYSGVQSPQAAPQYGVDAQAAQVEKQAVTRYCGQCGTGTNTAYCPQCGTQVPV